MKLIIKLFRIILAGITAFIILCILFTFYDLMPPHISSKLGNTDYVWPANAPWIKLTEGISCGRFDGQGFNNIKVIDNPDILVLGSSHMEAVDVTQNKNTAFLLQKKIGDRKTVYNMGISGHALTKVLQYLPDTLKIYTRVPEILIIETSNLSFSPESVNEVLKCEVERTVSHDSGLIFALQKLPFLRLMYHQGKNGLIDLLVPERVNKNQTADKKAEETNMRTDNHHYDELFSYINKLQKEYKTQIIIFYHPTEILQKDGSVYFTQDKNLKIFADKSKENDILFLDMTDAFYRLYEKEHRLPHGFIMGQIGTGHMNEDGHRVVAEELYRLLEEKGMN